MTQPSLTGGVGFVNNVVRPSGFRANDYSVNVATRPTPNAPHAPSVVPDVAVIGETSTERGAPVEGAETHAKASANPSSDVPASFKDQATGEEYFWWSPGMSETGASGYDDQSGGTYSYGGQGF